MTDLSSYLPKRSVVAKEIFDHHKKKGDTEPARGYLGASAIGHRCDRYLWYTFRACCKEDFPGRIYRLFETGDLAEIRFTKELRAIGCTVHDVDPVTDEQFEILDFGGHFSGHMDSCILGVPDAPKTWHVGEYKSHNAKSFAKLVKLGVEASKPVHYAQCQVYMHKTGMKRTLYLAVNKDTDDLYAERIDYDRAFSEAQMNRAKKIIFTTQPPLRCTDREDWWECKYCSAKGICWSKQASAIPLPGVSCRQCCHATPMTDGKARWYCEKRDQTISDEEMAKGCSHHLLLPGLVNESTPIDYGEDPEGRNYIIFEWDNGVQFTHGQGEGRFSTWELIVAPQAVVESPIVKRVKELFNAKIDQVIDNDPMARYPEGDSELLYKGPVGDLSDWWRGQYDQDFAKLEPIQKWDTQDYLAAEFSGSILVISWKNVVTEGSPLKIEIRKGKV